MLDRRTRAAVLALLVSAAVLGLQAPAPSAQQGGGTVTNSLPSADADGSYSNGTATFGDQDGVLGANLTVNDGQAGNVYDRNGAASQGNWGQWQATAGASGVESGNGTSLTGRYLKARANATGATPEVWEFEVFDPNLESDLRYVRLESDNPALNDTANGSDGKGHAVTPADLARTAKPTTGAGITADGYAVWNPTPNDGFLSVQFRYTWPSSQGGGTFAQKACAQDEGNASCDSGNLDLTTFTANATVTVDFSSGNFTAASGVIPLDGFIDLKYYVGPAANPSSVSSWQTSTDDLDGALSLNVEAPAYVWIWYVVDIPDLAGDDTYVAAFTFG